METDKSIIVYDKETGKIIKNLPYSENNLLTPLTGNQNLIVAPSEIKLKSYIDEKDYIVNSSIPETSSSVKGKSHDYELGGPLRYRFPRFISQSVETVGKIVLGGQHAHPTNLRGTYYPISGGTRFEFYDTTQFDELKLIRDDYFQILNTNISTLDGIYQVRGYTERALNAFKVSGTTYSSSSTFDYTATGDGFHMIRLQPVDGSVYGVSTDVEGCGVYQYNEKIRQSRYPVTNSYNVEHSTSIYKYGGASAYFPNTGGGTASYLYLDYQDDFTPAAEPGSANYFKLSFWIKFAQGKPSSDMIILGQKTGSSGHYYLKYETTPASFVFAYSTNDTGGDFDNTFSALIPSLTLTAWNHIQVEVAAYQEVRFFINGELVATDSLGSMERTFESYGSDAPFVMGADSDGSSPFYGYLDEVEMVWDDYSNGGSFLSGPTGSTMAIGATIDVPTGGNTGTENINLGLLLFNMNGPEGCKLFTEDGHKVQRVEANVAGYDHDRRLLYISNYGTTNDSPFSTSKGYIRGFNEGLTNGVVGATGNSQARHPFLAAVIGITSQGAVLDNIKKVEIDKQSTYESRNLNIVPMQGNSGECGDFYNLFGVAGACAAYGERTLTFAASDKQFSRILGAVLQTAVSGVSLSSDLIFNDINGLSFSVPEAYLNAFHADVNKFREGSENALATDISSIQSAFTISDLATSGSNKVIDVSYDSSLGTALPT